MGGQQTCPSACAESPGGLQRLGRTILTGTGLYWPLLGSSGQAGGGSHPSHPLAGTLQTGVASRCSVAGGAVGRTVWGHCWGWQWCCLFAQHFWLCSHLCWELLLVPLGPLESVAGKDVAGVIAVVITVPSISAEGFLKTQQQRSQCIAGCMLLHGLVLIPLAQWRPQPRAPEGGCCRQGLGPLRVPRASKQAVHHQGKRGGDLQGLHRDLGPGSGMLQRD